MTPRATLLLVDDDAVFRRVLAEELEERGFTVATAESGEEAVRVVGALDPDVVLLDLQLPGMDGLDVLRALNVKRPGTAVVVLTGHGSIDTAIQAIRCGAFDYIAKPCPIDELEVRIQRALESNTLRRRADVLERGLAPPDPQGGFLGESPAFRRTLDLLGRVAASETSVLVCGETGSGKEIAARLVHARSPRASRPFVVVDCAALQEELLQSELFGHERGAFTGADRAKPGLFEVADGGTIFLDEIGEVSLATQVKLLRVLDTSTFRHVGGTRELRVDVRVVAATNRDLGGLVAQGRFRQDLFYRLSTITIELPPLRARAGDIELLAAHFLQRLNRRYGFEKTIGAEALAALRAHDWPGNVRELLHAIEAAAAVCEGPQILPRHLPPAVLARRAANGAAHPDGELPRLVDLEREHIARALAATAGHRGRTAEILGISERNLYRKLKEHDLLG